MLGVLPLGAEFIASAPTGRVAIVAIIAAWATKRIGIGIPPFARKLITRTPLVPLTGSKGSRLDAAAMRH
jgi:hypothetical protein